MPLETPPAIRNHTPPNTYPRMIDMRSPNFSNHDTESGFILPTVLMVLVIVTILAVTTVTVAVKSSSSTTRDSNVKSALAAAEAGLQLATYRINHSKLKETECVTGSETKEAKEESVPCQSGSESLGNGASFKYYNTIALAKGECAGTTVVKVASIEKRCITSEGIVNGVSPHTRVQTLLESAVGEALFKVKGILGLEEVLVSGSVKATAVVASNDKIVGEGSAAFEKGFEICPGGKFEPAAGKERNKSGVTVDGIGGEKAAPAEYEKTRSASECPIPGTIPTIHANAAENEDNRIASGEDPNTGEPNLTYTPSTFGLEVGSKVNLTLGGSKYYFCKFTANKDGVVKIASGAKVEIFIDSHEDYSGCPSSGSSVFKIEGNAHLENPNGVSALLIEVAGKGPVAIENSGSLKANIYAPEAEVVLSGAGTLTGAIVGKKVHLTAGSFVYSGEDESFSVGSSSSGTNTRKAWTQCASGTGVASAC
jgi:Tfp pilus assembly protein PilX